MKSLHWFPVEPVREAPGAVAGGAPIIIGGAVGAALFARGHAVPAVVVWVISGGLGIPGLLSVRARTAIQRGASAFGRLAGELVAVLTLTPLLWLVLPLARAWMWIDRNDPLQLRRPREASTYWLAADSDERKRRHAAALFATEARRRTRGRPLVALGLLALVLAGVGEILLQAWGFGHPVLYQRDAGYGFCPAPNQDVTRSGNRVRTNAFGMRGPDVPPTPAPGRFRVLMIGDSTLYGGSYIDQRDLYSRRLEGRLREQSGRAGVDVLAIGVNGWGPFHKTGYVQRYGTFGADVAVICAPYRDIYRPLSQIQSLPIFDVAHPPVGGWHEVLLHLAWRFHGASLGPPDDDLLAAQGPVGIAEYARLVGMLRAAGCEVLVEILPTRPAGLGRGTPPAERDMVADLTDSLTSAGAVVGWPEGVFSSCPEPDRVYHDGVHLAALGHRLYAAYLASRIADSSARWTAWTAAPTGSDR